MTGAAWNDRAKLDAMSTDSTAAESREGGQTSVDQNDDDDDDEVLIINYTDGFGEEEFPQPVVIKQEIVMRDNADMEHEGCSDTEVKLEELEICKSEVRQKIGSFDWSEGPNLVYVRDVDVLSPTEENATVSNDVASKNSTESSVEDLKPLRLIDSQDTESERSKSPQTEPEEVSAPPTDFGTAELDGPDIAKPKEKPPLKKQLGGCDSVKPKRKPRLKTQVINSYSNDFSEVYMEKDCKKPSPKKLICSRCNFKTNSPKTLEIHQKTTCPERELKDNCANDAGDSEIFKCQVCDFVAKSQAGIVSHFRGHQNNKVRKCPYCDMKLAEGTLRTHVFARHRGGNIRLYKCSRCEFKTNNKYEMVPHRSKCQAKARIERKAKGRTKIEEKAGTERKANAKEKAQVMHKCKWCSYQSLYKNGLTLHNVVHTQQHQKIYSCFGCSFKSTKWCLMKHIRAHYEKDKLYQCSQCNFNSYSPWYFQTHLIKGCKTAKDGVRAVVDRDQTPECDSYSFVTKNSDTLKSRVHACDKPKAQHTYACPCCPYKTTRRLLPSHMKRAHSDSPSSAPKALRTDRYVCPKCEATFEGAWQLQLHILENKGLDRCLPIVEADDKHGNDDDAKRRCESCSYSTLNELDLAVHEIIFHCKDQQPRCKYCPFKGPKSRVVTHMKEAHGDTYVGKSGNGSGKVLKRFSSNKQLNEDEAQDYEAPPSKKAKARPRGKNVNQSDVGDEPESKKFKCDSCGFATRRKYSLSKHMLTHSDKNPSTQSRVGKKASKRSPTLRCSCCSFATYFRYNLLKHELTCERGPPKPKSDSQPKECRVGTKANQKSPMFRCSCCDYVTQFKYNLLNHELTYEHHPQTPNKPFKCDSCDFQSKYKSSLQHHTTLHQNEKGHKFKCEICEFEYDTKKALYTHIMVHGLKVNENERIFYCNVCDYESRIKLNWYKHMQTQMHKSNAKKSMEMSTDVELPEKVKKPKSDESDSANSKPLRGRGRSRKAIKEEVPDEDEAEPAAEQNDSDLEDLLDYIEISGANLPEDPPKTSKHAETDIKKSPKVKLKKRKEEIQDPKPAEENVVQKCPSCFFKCNSKGALWDHFSACHIPSN